MSESITRADIILAAIKCTVLAAITIYSFKFILDNVDPTSAQKKNAKKKAKSLLQRLGLSNNKEALSLTEHEMIIANRLVDPRDINVSWNSIAGLDNVLQELKETVIFPIQRKDLFGGSNLTRAPKGVLLFGPPGCGKTMIAKATAREAGCNFINLDVSTLTDKWYGESQKLTNAVFTLAVKLQPCIIFIDEIDSFLRGRSSSDHEATAMMKAQFMSLWDGLLTDASCSVIVMGTTNRPQDLDHAILRRMPSAFLIDLPNAIQRKQILDLILKKEPIDSNVNITQLADVTERFSGSDLIELCRTASLYRVREYMNNEMDVVQNEMSEACQQSTPKTGIEMAKFNLSKPSTSERSTTDSDDVFHDALRPIMMEDLLAAHRKMKKSKEYCVGYSNLLGIDSK